MPKNTRRSKATKVDTTLLAKGILQPSNSEDAVTIVTPLDELTLEDREDLAEFATFVLNMRSAPKPPPSRRCGSRR